VSVRTEVERKAAVVEEKSIVDEKQETGLPHQMINVQH